MQITKQQTEILLKGDYKFTLLSFAMLVTRLKKRYANDPSATVVQDSTNELNAFFDKWSNIVVTDYGIIQNL